MYSLKNELKMGLLTITAAVSCCMALDNNVRRGTGYNYYYYYALSIDIKQNCVMLMEVGTAPEDWGLET